jgi:hypothetical protein
LEMMQLVPEFESNNENFKFLVEMNKASYKLLKFHEIGVVKLK